jgi:hypothetical protein
MGENGDGKMETASCPSFYLEVVRQLAVSALVFLLHVADAEERARSFDHGTGLQQYRGSAMHEGSNA